MTQTSKPAEVTQVPENIVKVQEYLFFIENVRDGLWRNNTYLAELCDVERDTIADWKKTKPALEARRIANADLRRAFKGRGDIEKRMKEAGIEIEPNKLEVTHVIPILGGISNVSANNIDQETTPTK